MSTDNEQTQNVAAVREEIVSQFPSGIPRDYELNLIDKFRLVCFTTQS